MILTASTTDVQGVGPRPAATALRWVVPLAAATAVLVRLPLLAAPAAADEAGFLVIAREWSGPGQSLYGDYWVDRPPLLLVLFRVAALAGGLVPLRLLGCVAVVVTVLAAARVARLLAGPRSAAWTAVVSAALLSSPLLQAQQVNGELLAAPFVALGILAMVSALDPDRSRRAWLLAAASGAAAAAALLVKQNIADVLVFDAVLLLTAAATGRVGRGRAVLLGAAVGAGALVATVAVALWSLSRGADPVATAEAMYSFRLDALPVIAEAGEAPSTRAVPLVLAWVASGLAAALVLMLVRAVSTSSPVLLALAAVGVVDLMSVGLGGSFWLHYLLQPAVTAGIAIGLLVEGSARRNRARPVLVRGRAMPAPAPAVAGLVVLSSVVALAWSAPRLLAPDPVPTRIGEAVAEVAVPGDTLTALYGRPQVNQASGLPSPYPYLWNLPIRVRDPELREFESLLRSDRRPTWLVLGPETSTWGSSFGLGTVVYTHYTPVTTHRDLTVYLRRDSDRPDPPL